MVDSGRSAVKVITPEGFDLLIPAVVSPAHEITMDVDLSKEDYYWLQFEGEEYFVGRLAMNNLGLLIKIEAGKNLITITGL